MLEEEHVCRNCHEPGGDLIAPCMCSGSVKWVHRSCLNDWRAYSTNPNSFSHCDICGFQYEFRINEAARSGRAMKFALRFSRDFFGAMLIMQSVIWFFTLIVWLCDKKSEVLLDLFPETWSHVGIYYLWGLFIFSLIAATYGAMYLLYKCLCGGSNSGRSYSYFDYPYGWGPYYMWWYYPSGNSIGPMCGGGCCCCCCDGRGGGCSGGGGGSYSGGCGDCGGSSSNSNGGDGMAIGALIVMIVAIVIGVIVMVVIATIIFRRHAHILHKRAEAREKEIIDRSEFHDHSIQQMV